MLCASYKAAEGKIQSLLRGKLRQELVFDQDNAPAHTSAVAMASIHQCGFETLDQPPNSPDLAPVPKTEIRKGHWIAQKGDYVEK